MKEKTALTIAASDPSGGAGVQADLKTFSFTQVHGASVITCITAQNTTGVQAIYPLPQEVIKKQLETIMDDLTIKTAKTGMLYSRDIINFLSKKLYEYGLKIIVDPVMISTTGQQLIKNNIPRILACKLIPQAYLVTPNINEASCLTQMKITGIKEVKEACKKIKEMGPKYVLIKGGHLPSINATDVLYDGKKYYLFSLPRIKSNTHGSGCTLSALITAYVTKGMNLLDAIKKTKRYMWGMMYYGYYPGKGIAIMNHNPPHYPPILRTSYISHWITLQSATDQLISILPPQMIPEVGINFGYALPNATQIKDVLGISGRIVKRNKKLFQVGEIQLGASKHIASIILTCMAQNSEKRAALNIAYSPNFLSHAKKEELKIGSFNRKKEPPNQRTMDWGTKNVIKSQGGIPDIIWDSGAPGKEPMIRIIAETPKEILRIIKKLTEKY